MKKLILTFAITLLTLPVVAEPPSYSFNLRGRAEIFDTPSPDASRDDSYELFLLRGRFNLDWGISDAWTLHGTAQAAAMTGIPENGAFGIGPVYFAPNRGDTSPTHLDIAELWGRYSRDDLTLTFGRMPYADGAETMTGVSYLDGVKKARVAERLIGNWDWVNVGRRYDGATLSWESEAWDVTAFWLNPLAGGVNYEEAFTSLDDLSVFGASATSRYDTLFNNGEGRLFLYSYDDKRRGAINAAGGPVEIQTVGGHLLFGSGMTDLLIWAAIQVGDWGPRDHEAYAAVAETGMRFADWTWSPAVRVGAAIASGGSGNDHETFFNMLPTNHKWYGAMDYSAFQNLQDVYLIVSTTPKAGWALNGELHAFFLDDDADAWYGGSGPFAEGALGYAARRPAGGFAHSDVGYEIDLTVKAPLPYGLTGLFGASHFIAGDAGDQILAADDSGTWLFAQLAWKM